MIAFILRVTTARILSWRKATSSTEYLNACEASETCAYKWKTNKLYSWQPLLATTAARWVRNRRTRSCWSPNATYHRRFQSWTVVAYHVLYERDPTWFESNLITKPSTPLHSRTKRKSELLRPRTRMWPKRRHIFHRNKVLSQRGCISKKIELRQR